MTGTVPLIIPAYQPGEGLVVLSERVASYPLGPVIVVDDGSGPDYAAIFTRTMGILGEKGILLAHAVNGGKGAALKTAFRYALDEMPGCTGVVTADADGQHAPEDIERVARELADDPSGVVLGSRRFDGPEVPWKSKFGNSLTSTVFALVSGIRLRDTQTGLRGIPSGLLPRFLLIPENRFEYEMKMLLKCDRKAVREIDIATIYDSPTDHATHFDPVKDSWRIYRILLGQFFRFSGVSLSSALLDLVAFWILSHVFKAIGAHLFIAYATIIARIVSSIYNYAANHRFVFRSERGHSSTSTKYFSLVVVQMLASAAGTTLAHHALGFVPPVILKIGVDSLLFFFSYRIQKRHIF